MNRNLSDEMKSNGELKMKLHRIIFCLAAALLFTGCVPERYVWSPNGKWMTVIGDKGLAFSDADGKLLPTIIDGAQVAAWFPDSTRVLVERQIEVNTPKDAARYLTSEQVQSATDAA